VLATTTVPLLLIDGLDDPVSGAHLVRAFRDAVPHAACAELAGIGHYPQLEAQAEVLREYRRWRDGLGA
jgi:pimeloyl-ACP methyl ester carboxylesterase